MQRNSKTLKEIYREKYPIKDTVKKPTLCSEAVGYLKGILQFNPSEEWINDEILIMLIMLMGSLKDGE